MSREARPVVQTRTPTILEWLEIKSQQRAAREARNAQPQRVEPEPAGILNARTGEIQ